MAQTYNIIYSFSGCADAGGPTSTLILDRSGSLYATAKSGGAPCGVRGWGVAFKLKPATGSGSGTVFELTPSGSGWTPKVLYTFTGGTDGGEPVGGLVMDAAGNLYGSTVEGGTGGGGTIFELSPSGGSWTFGTLYSLVGGGGPLSSLTIDAAGNLYGTAFLDGASGVGSVFKLTHSGGSWTFTDLHDFQANSGGVTPIGGVTLDGSGNLYGTTIDGGTRGAGVIWEITPN
jgi:uncharacterized repeat protein (TIGR03803 family)